MLKHDSIPGKVIDYVLVHKIIPIINEDIIHEYLDVLTRNKFFIDLKDINKMLKVFRKNGISLDKIDTLESFIDKDDAVFYEITMSARRTMDAYLVTGNLKHFPQKSYVVSPREMIAIVESNT